MPSSYRTTRRSRTSSTQPSHTSRRTRTPRASSSSCSPWRSARQERRRRLRACERNFVARLAPRRRHRRASHPCSLPDQDLPRWHRPPSCGHPPTHLPAQATQASIRVQQRVPGCCQRLPRCRQRAPRHRPVPSYPVVSRRAPPRHSLRIQFAEMGFSLHALDKGAECPGKVRGAVTDVTDVTARSTREASAPARGAAHAPGRVEPRRAVRGLCVATRRVSVPSRSRPVAFPSFTGRTHAYSRAAARPRVDRRPTPPPPVSNSLSCAANIASPPRSSTSP